MDKRFGCVVLKAQECDWQNAHVTMLFMGEVKDYREGILDEILEALHSRFKGINYLVQPTGRGSWKVSNKTTAYPVLNDELDTCHRKLGLLLIPLGIRDESKYPFNPHISTPNGYELPICLELSPFQLWWGGEIHDIV